MTAPVVVVGAGVAGLAGALAIRDRPVVIFTLGPVSEDGASPLAQGGIAAAVGPDDAPELHAEDTMAAGAGVGRRDRALLLARAAPREIERLLSLGARFERDERGALALGREAAHRRARIVHAGGDATGREVMRVLGRAVGARPNVEVRDGAEVIALAVADGRVGGVDVRFGSGRVERVVTGAVLIATGGVGALWEATTNPPHAVGSGLALAARAGVQLADLELVQFHPTALDANGETGCRRPAPLLSEALRGAGAMLVDAHGRPLSIEHPDGPLAPRDVVARAVAAERAQHGRVFLDVRMLDLDARFPTAAAAAREAGLDPRRDLLPVRPAAHFHMGGIATDDRGATSLEGLRAAGEVACTGVHGANRLASNSLLEGLVFGRRAGEGFAATAPRPANAPAAFRPAVTPEGVRRRIRALMERHVNVVRDEPGLLRATAELALLPGEEALVAGLIAGAARARRETVGAHARSDAIHTAA